MSNNLICLINDLLNWREGAHPVLGDYLEDLGFARRFQEHGGLFSRVGVVLALLSIQAISPKVVWQLEMPDSEKREAIARFEELTI